MLETSGADFKSSEIGAHSGSLSGDYSLRSKSSRPTISTSSQLHQPPPATLRSEIMGEFASHGGSRAPIVPQFYRGAASA